MMDLEEYLTYQWRMMLFGASLVTSGIEVGKELPSKGIPDVA